MVAYNVKELIIEVYISRRKSVGNKGFLLPTNLPVFLSIKLSSLQYLNTGIFFQNLLHIFTTDVFPFMFHFYVSTL